LKWGVSRAPCEPVSFFWNLSVSAGPPHWPFFFSIDLPWINSRRLRHFPHRPQGRAPFLYYRLVFLQFIPFFPNLPFPQSSELLPRRERQLDPPLHYFSFPQFLWPPPEDFQVIELPLTKTTACPSAVGLPLPPSLLRRLDRHLNLIFRLLDSLCAFLWSPFFFFKPSV